MAAHRELSPSKLVSKKTTGNSAVWQHFGFEPDEKGEPLDPDVVVCKLCLRDVKGNTSNLKAHPLKNYPREYAALGLPRPKTSSSTKTKKGQPSYSLFTRAQSSSVYRLYRLFGTCSADRGVVNWYGNFGKVWQLSCLGSRGIKNKMYLIQ